MDTIKGKGSRPNEVEAIMDSGTNVHFCPEHENFTNFINTPPLPIRAADGCTFYATGKGDVSVNLPNGNHST